MFALVDDESTQVLARFGSDAGANERFVDYKQPTASFWVQKRVRSYRHSGVTVTDAV